ncbi:MAG TPA: hypothetical protein VJ183_08035 [Chloroflexia bacterium]|nr:hypothetical protein [Chloroflexia bacterium]
MRNRLLAAVTILFILFGAQLRTPSAVHACSCGGPSTAREALEGSDAVFFGRVISVTGASEQVQQVSHGYISIAVVLEVISIWKGVSAGQVTVYTGSGGGDCGVSFEVGELRLVYANAADDGRLGTGICSYFRPADAPKDVDELGPGIPPLSKEILAEEESQYQASVAESTPQPTSSELLPHFAVYAILSIGTLAILLIWVIYRKRHSA